MPRGIKNTATTETTVDTAVETTVDITTFKSAIIELGTKLCNDIIDGKCREPIDTMKEVAELYAAIK